MNLLQQLEYNHAPGPHYELAGDDDLSGAELAVQLIAFYLPQFHPVAQNDAWWGTGFTEWTNVTKALPRFRGHYQPRLPADVGFYDLRVPEVLDQQARLARRHGLHGFCFYHYWFSGERILERPVETLLAHPEIDLPFCVSWANENWTRTWDGGEKHILLAQRYTPEDDVRFADDLVPMLRDPRYIRVEGRPLVLVYRPALLPDPAASFARWQARWTAAGVGEVLIVMTQSFGLADPRPYGLEMAVEFPPHPTRERPVPGTRDSVMLFDGRFQGWVSDYSELAAHFSSTPEADYPVFRCVVPSWDNEARRPNRGRVIRGSTPERYGRWLDAACRRTIAENPPGRRLAFVNAWNEWAEGAYLEPDRHFGHAYLRTTGRVLQGLTAEGAPGDCRPGSYVPEVPARDMSVSAQAVRYVHRQYARANNVTRRILTGSPIIPR